MTCGMEPAGQGEGGSEVTMVTYGNRKQTEQQRHRLPKDIRLYNEWQGWAGGGGSLG